MRTRSEATTVGAYVTLVRGTTYEGRLVGEPGPALLGLGSIVPGGGFRAGDFKTYGGECPDELMLVPGDIYASLKGATKDGKMIGSVARVPSSVPSGRLTQDTVKLVFKERSPEVASFLYWVLRTPQYRDYCAGHAMGSAVVALSRRDFLSYSVPPRTSDRMVLVHLLNEIEEKIDLGRRMSDTLDSMARALFRSWFVDFDPVRAKMDGRNPGLSELIADHFPERLVDSELGHIPSGWGVESLGSQYEATKGVSYKGSDLAESGMPLHNLNSIYEGGGYKHQGIKFYSGEFGDRHVLRPGDVIVANTEQGHERRLIGYAAIVPSIFGPQGIASHHLYRIRPKREAELTGAYLCWLLNSTRMHEVVSGHANGTTVNMLPIDGVQKPRIVRPPQRLVMAFDSFATNVESRRAKLVLESNTLVAVRDALLPKLITGELRVQDVERQSAEVM